MGSEMCIRDSWYTESFLVVDCWASTRSFLGPYLVSFDPLPLRGVFGSGKGKLFLYTSLSQSSDIHISFVDTSHPVCASLATTLRDLEDLQLEPPPMCRSSGNTLPLQRHLHSPLRMPPSCTSLPFQLPGQSFHLYHHPPPVVTSDHWPCRSDGSMNCTQLHVLGLCNAPCLR